MEAHWTEQVLTEEWLKGPEDTFPRVPAAALLDDTGAVGPETNPRRKDASQVPREGNDDE